MQKKKQKVRSTVEIAKDNEKPLFELSLEAFSYGPFCIGGKFSDYQDIVRKGTVQYGDWDTGEKYLATNVNYALLLWFSKGGRLGTMGFYDHCYYHGIDLIGMRIFDFLSMINKEPDRVDIDWIPTKDENHGQRHRCYVFYYPHSKVLQLWTWRKRINNIMIYDYSID